MFICQNAEGVHGKRKVGNPCSSSWGIIARNVAGMVLWLLWALKRLKSENVQSSAL